MLSIIKLRSSINVPNQTINRAFLIKTRWMLNSISAFNSDMGFIWADEFAFYLIAIEPCLVVRDVLVAEER